MPTNPFSGQTVIVKNQRINLHKEVNIRVAVASFSFLFSQPAIAYRIVQYAIGTIAESATSKRAYETVFSSDEVIHRNIVPTVTSLLKSRYGLMLFINANKDQQRVF